MKYNKILSLLYNNISELEIEHFPKLSWSFSRNSAFSISVQIVRHFLFF